MIRGIRGATTIQVDTEDEIVRATGKMMQELIDLNEIQPDDVASVFFSVTEDIKAAFPAKALRTIEGWTYVPVMCMKEIPVKGSINMCIRVMVHANTIKSPQEIQHVYQEGATGLRPDLKLT